MNAVRSNHHYADAATAQTPGLHSDDFMLEVVQQPVQALLAVGKEGKERKSVEPPPVIKLVVHRHADPSQKYLASPYYFIYCTLAVRDTDGSNGITGGALTGNLVSSLHRLRDNKGYENAYFIFPDLSIKTDGKHKLMFYLMEMRNAECVYVKTIISATFEVYAKRFYTGPLPSTALTRIFNSQGVKVRLHKDPAKSKRRNGPGSDDYVKRSNNPSKKPKRVDETPWEGRSISQEAEQQAELSIATPHQLQPFQQQSEQKRQYPQQSSSSYPGSFAYDERPRQTGSGQGQSTPTISQQSQSGMMNASHMSYLQQTSPSSDLGFMISPTAVATSSRAQLLPQSVGFLAPFDLNAQRSPTTRQQADVMPQTPRRLQPGYQASPMDLPQPQSLSQSYHQRNDGFSGSLPGWGLRTTFDMGAPGLQLGSSSDDAGYGRQAYPVHPNYSTSIDRRELYRGYHGSSQVSPTGYSGGMPHSQMSAGNMDNMYTSAPGDPSTLVTWRL